MDPIKIVIWLEGGSVTGVGASVQEVEVDIIDLDEPPDDIEGKTLAAEESCPFTVY